MIPRSGTSSTTGPTSKRGRARSQGSGSQRAVSVEGSPNDRASVQEYLDRFAAAMTAGDTRTMAKLWGVPAFVVGKNEARAVQSEAEVEQFFSGAKDMYNQRGIFETRAEIVDLDWIDEDLVIAKVRWPYVDQNDRVLGEETSSYTLLRGEDGGFKVRVVTMRGESETT